MNELAVFESNTEIKTSFGEPIRIIKYLASGGQGDVYLVEYAKEKKALKWYKPAALKNPNAFYANLKANVEKGSFGDAFLWPEAITEVVGGSFGYVMNLRPEGYYDLSKILGSKTCNFSSFQAAVEACIEIVNAFRLLHNEGYSYQDLNDGNFFIDPATGKVLICDNDNVAFNGTNTGILGKPKYMSPEIVTGKGGVLPNTQSDRYSLAAILFLILFMAHPLEGERFFGEICITDALAEKIYGSDPLFIFDPEGRNKPADKISICRWKFMPNYLKEAFLKAFSQEALKNPDRRLRELDWLKVLVRFRSDIAKCSCGNEVFIQNANTTICDACRNPVPVKYSIKLPGYSISAVKGSRVYRCQLGTCNADEALNPVALVVAKPDNPDVLGLKNMSGKTLNAVTPSGNTRLVQPKETIPFKTGISVEVFDKVIELKENI